MNCYWQKTLGPMLLEPSVYGTPAPLPCFITRVLHFEVLGTNVSKHGWCDLKARGYYPLLYQSERAEANAASQGAETQN